MNQLQEQSYATHIQDELLAIEKGFWERGNEADYFRHNMVDGGLAVLAEGVMTKQDAVEMTGASKPWRGVSYTDIRVMPLSADCAALLYTATGNRPDNNEPYHSRVTSVYQRRNGKWQIALHQQTVIPDQKTLPK
jgi:hypothetical protein